MTHRYYLKTSSSSLSSVGPTVEKKTFKMEFQERAIHRPDLVFLDEMMLELDEIEEENDLMEQENWEDMGLVFFKDFFG